MIEISIIVQLREIAGAKAGRISVGFSKIETETLMPKKIWSQSFFAALDRAISKRRRNLLEIERIATEEPPLFREPF